MTFRRVNIIQLAFLVVTIFVAFKAVFLVYPDIAITYPFTSYDSFQWLADGLFYGGANLESTYRQIGLPLVVATLETFNALQFLPVATSGLLLLFLLALVKLLRPSFSPGIVALIILLIGFNYRVHAFFDIVLADQWALTFMTLSIACLVYAVKQPRYWTPCLALAAVSFLFQYAISFSLAAYILAIFYALKEREYRASHIRNLCAGGIVALFIIGPPFIWKWVTKGSPFYSHVNPGQLVEPHFYSVFYYASNFFAFLGIPAAILTIKGLHTTSPTSRILMAGFVGQIFFWVFLYVWHDVRFILYILPFATYFTAKGIEILGASTSWNNVIKSAGARITCVVIGLPLLLSFGFFNTGDPLVPNLLPITPQCAVEFSTEPITKWGGNVTINLRSIALRYYTNRIPGFDAPIGYILRRRGIPEVSRQELNDLTAIRKILDSNRITNRLSEANSLPNDYFSVMKRNITLRRQPQTSGIAIPTLRLTAQHEESEQSLFKGKVFALDMQ